MDKEQLTESSLLSPFVITDKWTSDDFFGYSSYSYAIARFLTHPKTRPPVYISIQNPFGGYKTTLMRLIQHEIDKGFLDQYLYRTNHVSQGELSVKDILKLLDDGQEARNKTEPVKIQSVSAGKESIAPRISIWFDAWKYENTEQVWSGLADSIILQIAEHLSPTERQVFFFQLHKRRYGIEDLADKIYDRVSGYSRKKTILWSWLLPFALILGAASASVLTQTNTQAAVPLGLSGIAISVILAVLQALQQRQNTEFLQTPWDRLLWRISRVKKKLAGELLKEYVNAPDYTKKEDLMHNIDDDLTMAFNIIPSEYLPVVIFIDNLNLCSPNRIASIIETITNSVPQKVPDCMFVIGMDHDIIEKALQVAHGLNISDVTKYKLRSPHNIMMDKLEQLSFVIPPLDEYNLEAYVNSLLPPKQDTSATKKTLKEESATELISYKEEERMMIQDLNERINSFSELDPEIRDIIGDTVFYYLGGDWRQLNLFLNAFKFQYYLRNARLSRGYPVASLRQIRDWIILSSSWKGVIKWLGQIPSCVEFGSERETISTNIRKRLVILEDLASEGWAKDKIYQQVTGAYPELEDDINRWLEDKCLANFFKHQVRLPTEERLSAAVGMGLF
jgi:hypothetical protein